MSVEYQILKRCAWKYYVIFTASNFRYISLKVFNLVFIYKNVSISIFHFYNIAQPPYKFQENYVKS